MIRYYYQVTFGLDVLLRYGPLLLLLNNFLLEH